MKTKFCALLASAALIAQAQAGGHHGGGGGGFAAAGPGPARSSGGPSFHSMPMGSFGGGRMIYSGQRFSSVGMRSPGYRQHYINPNGGATVRASQFTPGNINRGNRIARFSNTGNRGENRAITNLRREGPGAGQIRSGNNLPTNWRNHVVAQHSANWQRNWNRSRDHVWRGHHCRFINGSWVIFDFGFYPWWPYWSPYDYYAYNYYPYGYYPSPYDYDPGYYDSGVYQNEEYYGQNGYGDSADSTVAAAQQQLAREGYYRGQIDGVVGPETRRAVARYQSSHGLRVTGALTADTLEALGLRPS
ncbi:MAG TPA: peptidoglycan-binding domain-containing protein [Candidatus Udaeobacter sp.]|nr:peptidoglycan-binding domain-containing protein [Candidatus Udaeobacter sp.]